MQSLLSPQWSAIGGAVASRPVMRLRRRSGITLTEILIAIMILGVGLVSLATLFPIGLLRLREAARSTRSALLFESAASDALARGLLSSQSFAYADYLNAAVNPNSPPYWYVTPSGRYNPLTQDTQYYSYNGGDWWDPANKVFAGAHPSNGPGLPIAYDPLWRYQALDSNAPAANGVANQPGGYYLGSTYEARFGYGLTSIRTDSDGLPPSAHGLQRITNFNRPTVMGTSLNVPNIFVSPEDLLWQDPNAQGTPYTVGGVPNGTPVTNPSPIVPDLNASLGVMTQDLHYSWMFTGNLIDTGNSSTFDGSIVIFENRAFGIHQAATPAYNPPGNYATQNYAVEGEIVVEGVFGFSGNVINASGQQGGPGYGVGANRTVLLRWPTTMTDPVVRPGDWIADVTYERQYAVVLSRYLSWLQPSGGLANWANNGEWDNLPAQRCFWYQVQKVTTPDVDPQLGINYRSMIVFVNQNLRARTVLNGDGTPTYLNAALIVPNVVNVIPQQIFVR